MQIIKAFVFLVIALVLQGTIKYAWNIDLVLPLVIAVSLKYGEETTLVFAFIAGFLQDASFAAGYINTLMKTLTAVLLYAIKSMMALEDDSACTVLAVIITPVYFIAAFFMQYIFQSPDHISFPWLNLIISTVINAVLAPCYFWLLNRILPNENQI